MKGKGRLAVTGLGYQGHPLPSDEMFLYVCRDTAPVFLLMFVDLDPDTGRKREEQEEPVV